jgi:hypothetical protein
MTKITNYLKLGFCLFIILLCSCKTKLKTDNAIYYCMDRLSLDSGQMKIIKEAGVKKLYVKFFDVYWNRITKAPNPIAKLEVNKITKDWLKANGVEVIPVIFLTNECLEKIDTGKYIELAERIYKLLDGMVVYYRMLPDIHEVQFNCDWTESTRGTYFSMINYMRMLPMIFDRKLTVSAAIYFDQYQNAEKLGIPPVNRATLMCFRSLKQDPSRNTVRTFKDDLASLNKYPLPLDIVLSLPVDHFLYRNDRLTGILQNLSNSNREDSIISTINLTLHRVNKDTMLNGTQVLKGDDIYEPKENIENLMNYELIMKPKLSSNNISIGIFWTDSSAVRNYAASYLSTVFNGMQ